MRRRDTAAVALGIVSIGVLLAVALVVGLFALSAVQTPRGVAGALTDFAAGFAVLGGVMAPLSGVCAVIGLVLAVRARSVRGAALNVLGLLGVVTVVVLAMTRGA